MTLFAGGIVIGLSLGWGLYWYLTQRKPAFRRLETVEAPVLFRRAGKARSEPATHRDVQVELEPADAAFRPAPPPLETVAEEELPEPLTAYCVRCRAKRSVRDPEPAGTQNGQTGYRGTCEVCGARVFALQ